MKGAITSAIVAAVEANWELQIAFLQRLVRYPTLRGCEADCQRWLAQEFSARGWDVDCYTLAEAGVEAHSDYAPHGDADLSKALQIVATVGRTSHPFSSGRSLILQGHVDVVPTGPTELWREAPFSGRSDGAWLYGRGAQDMKAGISALVFALDAIECAGIELLAPVFLQTVTDEESTGNGALSTLLRGYRADACLIPEPTDNTITRGQVGAVWFKLIVRGKPVHVARAQAGSNAIISTYTLLSALQELTKNANIRAASHPLFASLINPIKFNPGIIRGGDWPSSTPAWCELECRFGVLPDQTIEEVQRQIVDTIAAAASADEFLKSNPPEIVWTGFLANGSILEGGSVAERVLNEAHRSMFGEDMEARLSTAVTDTRYYAREGIPALCYGPAGKGMHGFDERADLENLKRTTAVIASFVVSWCNHTAGH